MPHCLGWKIDVTDSRMLRISVHRRKKKKKKKNSMALYGRARSPRWVIKVQNAWELTLKARSHICSRQHFEFVIYFSEKVSIDISCDESAWLMIHMKCHNIIL